MSQARFHRPTFIFVATILSVVATISVVAAPVAAQEKRPTRPNVLLIYTDAQGSVDLNCYGAQDLATPHLDALAARGVRFTQMYAPSAICSASRAGLLTGRFPARSGVPGNVSSQKGRPGMPAEQVTMAEMFQAAGYATAHVGKWHLGFTPETMPNGQGFEQSFGHMGGCIDNYSHFFYWNGPNRHDLWRNGQEIWEDGKFFPDLMVRECSHFLETRAAGKRPFFLYWAINVPHYPLQATKRWRKHYEKLASPRREYAAFVSTMDERIGQVLAKLDSLGLRENTIVVFQSDHGHSTEERTFFGGGNAGPYRGAEACLFEGGLRIPSIAAFPHVIPAGEVRDQWATGCDWLPTLAKLCRVALPQRTLDGKELTAVLKSSAAPSPHQRFYWRLGVGAKAQWVVREGDWKLLGNPRDTSAPRNSPKLGVRFLVNLQTDIGETKNVAAQHPEVLARLENLQQEFEASIASK